MQVNGTGFAAKELVEKKYSNDHELTRQAQDKAEIIQNNQNPLAPRPLEQPSGDKLRRIDIYA